MKSTGPHERPADILSGLLDMRASYRMSHTGPHKKERSGIPTYGVGADWNNSSQSTHFRMVELSRDLAVNDPIVAPGLKRLVSNIVGQGFTPDPDTGDYEVDVALKEEVEPWLADPTLQGGVSFSQLERNAFLAVLRDGDILHIPVIDPETNTGKLQVFESHQIRDPSNVGSRNIKCGVEKNANNKHTAYYLAPEVQSTRALYGGTASVQVPAYDAIGNRLAFFVSLIDRFTQTRGVPLVQPAYDFVSYHDDIQFAQLVKANIASCVVFLRTRMAGSGSNFGSANNSNTTNEQFSDGNTRRVEELFPGKEIYGDEGEMIQGFSPNVPNAEYFNHISLILQIISVNLDLPVQVLLLDPTQTNFSGWRGATDQAKMRWREMQDTFAHRFHRHVWAWKCRELAATKRYFAQAKERLPFYDRCIWHPPSWPYIEPMKDAQADAFQISNLLNSPRRIYAKRSLQYDTVIQEIVSDNTDAIMLAKQAAQQINTRFPDDPHQVSWQEVLTIPQTGDISQSRSMTEDSSDGSTDANNS